MQSVYLLKSAHHRIGPSFSRVIANQSRSHWLPIQGNLHSLKKSQGNVKLKRQWHCEDEMLIMD